MYKLKYFAKAQLKRKFNLRNPSKDLVQYQEDILLFHRACKTTIHIARDIFNLNQWQIRHLLYYDPNKRKVQNDKTIKRLDDKLVKRYLCKTHGVKNPSDSLIRYRRELLQLNREIRKISHIACDIFNLDIRFLRLQITAQTNKSIINGLG